MAPSISPTTIGQLSYTITDSAAFLATFTMDSNILDIRFFTVTRPDPAPGLAIVLRHVASGTEIALDTLVGTNTSIAGRSITVSTSPSSAGTVQLTCNIQNTNGSNGIAERWQLRVSATAPAAWAFTIDDAVTSKITRLLCDPAAGFSAAPPATVFEKEPVTLIAANATLNTVVGTPVPAVIYQWEHTGPIAIMELPACGPSQTLTINAPGVYRNVAVPITLTAAFETTCGTLGTALLKRTVAAPAAMTIKPRPQQIALVLDRSGSMALEDRWGNAETAARMLTNLFVAFREGVHPDDRIGILVFEDDTCQWHAPPASPKIAAVLAPSKISDAGSAICGLALGSPGSCTPIGDGLIAGMDTLAAGGPNAENPDPDAKFTLVLVTDGYINAGSVQVGPGALPPGVTPFAIARTATPQRAGVNLRLNVYTIGLGATVDEQVLNNLGNQSVQNRYLLITDPTQLADAFGEMLSVSQEVNRLVTHATPPSGIPDPNPPAAPANAAYFTTSARADKLGLGVLAASGTIELARRQSTGFIPEGAIKPCAGHIIGSVADLTALGSGTIEWRVVHKIGGADQALPLGNVLAYEDLHVKSDILLDKDEYRTGDQMRLTVRLRDDSEPIRKATVRVVLDAPDVGLGETLCSLGPKFVPKRRGEDPAAGKGALIEEVMRRNGWKRWPRSQPTGIFVNNTDELHDPDGDGNYTNTFAKVFKEGTYSWELLVNGEDAKGNRFDRRIIISTHAGVKVNPRTTTVQVTGITKHPSGLNAARVIIVPRDVRGERLGPGWDHAVIWTLEDGIFEQAWSKKPPAVFTDGTYQRVILYKQDQSPVLLVSAYGTVLPKIAVSELVA